MTSEWAEGSTEHFSWQLTTRRDVVILLGMTKTILPLLAIALLIGCSAGDDESPDGCADRPETDSYLVSFTETAGNCGMIPSAIVSGNEELPEGCTEYSTVDDNNCREGGQGRCVNTETGVTFQFYAVCVWNESSTSADCVYDYDFTGTIVCSSTYEATMERL